MTGTGAPGRIVLRPRRGRFVVYVCAVAVLAVLGGIAVALPSETWGLSSRVGLALVAVVTAAFLHRLASVRVEADDDGVRVVNILTSRRLAWAEVVGVRLVADDPWMMLDLSDGTAMAAMGVQKADGDRARRQAKAFARMVVERTQTPREG